MDLTVPKGRREKSKSGSGEITTDLRKAETYYLNSYAGFGSEIDYRQVQWFEKQTASFSTLRLRRSHDRLTENRLGVDVSTSGVAICYAEGSSKYK
ncbi:hypothetical protein Baya_5777 [Bagarius yarrelli]|uniref:Uncharacterized protein n=1 Tax=Bagarius yarrelli TaxID=175774 RepID=A0A556TYG1_BAGYA|nr:hypothetical protein Baya_5777 [Bagarius yarrelli]